MNAEALVAAGATSDEPSLPASLPEPAAPAHRVHGTLGPIALALSGGGYRAAGFHLGTLRLLHRVGLLDDVVALSTVSGGTLFGAAWVVSLLDRKGFEEFDTSFARFLRRTNVIREALDGLAATRSAHRDASPSLIRAAAGVYAAPDFLGHRRLGEVLESTTLPLDEVIFNSTEFHTGVDFRFRRSANPRAVVGNGNFRVPRAVAAQARLADVAAASSCFPSVFEPFVFPGEFTWPASYPLTEVRNALADAGWSGADSDGGLPLMDGGVYDNQGLGSLLLAYRDAAEPPLLLVSDTSPPQSELYRAPAGGSRGWLTLRGAVFLAWAVFLAAVASLVVVAASALDDPQRFTPRGALVYGIPLLFSAAVAGGMLWLRGLAREVRTLLRTRAQVRDAWDDLRELTVREAMRMVELRAGSLVALSSSVFMKRIRGLVYGAAYTDDTFRPRLAPVLVYSLARGSGLFDRHPWLRPGAGLRDLAARAGAVPTALWLTDDAELDTLADAGEASACFELLRFVLRDADGRLAAGDGARAELLARLRRRWEEIGRRAGDAVSPPAQPGYSPPR